MQPPPSPEANQKRRDVILYLVAVAVGAPIILGGLALVVFLSARTELLGAAPLAGPGEAQVRFRAPPTGVALWADLDASWRGSRGSKPEVTYEIEVKHGARSLGRVTCSSTERAGAAICGTVSRVGAKHSGDCEVALACELPALPAGEEIELTVRGSVGSNVIEMRKMSLHVRAK